MPTRSAGTYIDEKGKARPDAEAIQRSRLRVEMRKWRLAKTLPRVWGDKPQAGDDGASGPFPLEALVLGSLKAKPESEK